MSSIDFKQIYNREKFLTFLEKDFLPEDFRIESENLDFSAKYTQQVTRLGECQSLRLDIIEIIHTSNHDARVSLSKEAFRLLLERSKHNRALILFIPKDKPATYRFSLVSIDVALDEHKVRRSYSNPRRYSFLLGEDAKVHTPTQYLVNKGRVKDLEDIKKRFSVEVLTKEFYAELSDWYSWAISEVKFPGEKKDATKEKRIEHNSKNVIRLLTRLLFVWFLKQKHLIPNEFFNEQYIADKLLKNFEPNKFEGLGLYKPNDSKYYKAILQNLFFAMLNCPIVPHNEGDTRERGFRKNNSYGQHRDANYLMRYENLFKEPTLFLELANKQVPFLNGGLFDCLDNKSAQPAEYIDGFSDNLPAPHQLIVPDYLFFGEEKGKNIDLTWFYGNSKKKKSANIRGLIDILETYNFTIEENTPYDKEVSLDPELLGKVFENLLASYNPETKTTARKQTGSFYTPREIVQYMVDESLIAHLKRTVGSSLEEEYRKLILYTDETIILSEQQKSKIIKSLFSYKVMDPACGSGAFPVGMLQQMVHILSQLDPENKLWKEIQKQEALAETSIAFDVDDETLRAETLAEIERNFNNNLSRPDYARKLYLIENCIYGVDIQPIAVQISKLRFFISLVVEQNVTTDSNDNFGIRPLPNLEAKFVAANALIGLDKQGSLSETNEVRKEQETLKHIRHKIFSARRPETKRKLRQRDKETREKIAKLLKSSGFLDSNSANKMAKWDPYDQNTSAPFFDTEWMFGEEKGFDIVIGNPPYGVSIKGEYRKQVGKYLGKVPDYEIYYYFIEIAKKIVSDTGIMSYIIPNTYLFNTFADKYRKSILDNWNIIEILDCTKFPVFDATVLNTINIWQKGKSQFVGYRNTSKSHSFEELITEPRESIEKSDLLSMNQNWGLAFFLKPNVIAVINKINHNRKKLEEFFPQISQGLIAYDKYKGQDKTIIENRAYHHSTYQDGYKKWLWGEDVSRYSINWNGKEYIDYCEGIANPRNPIFFTNKRILVREITNPSIFAAITSEELYNDPAIINILDSGLYSIKVTLAILNSKLATFYHFNHSPKATKGAFPKILVQDIKDFPLPEINNNAKYVIESLVGYLLFLNDKSKFIDLGITSKRLFVVNIFDKVIDACIYELYFTDEIQPQQVDVIELVAHNLKQIESQSIEEQITHLFNEWNDYKNEVRNRIILQETRSKSVSEIIQSIQ
ncbi:Eco57I restriction-modification methylase domain-containing protein [Proteiniphilum sp. UBA5510]|uniref:Eco57I restriction-modification methylase domain-containing protein n=1 Tax=Proteiniphilum sp. UBA5510 TaxID=1947286 RepID=UPI002580361C|nr:TaqI-like C-terminal specificity domain-containing protein [Proteiniphilum sp. UBA5510]